LELIRIWGFVGTLNFFRRSAVLLQSKFKTMTVDEKNQREVAAININLNDEDPDFDIKLKWLTARDVFK